MILLHENCLRISNLHRECIKFISVKFVLFLHLYTLLYVIFSLFKWLRYRVTLLLPGELERITPLYIYFN
jgi:hypothetical protein